MRVADLESARDLSAKAPTVRLSRHGAHVGDSQPIREGFPHADGRRHLQWNDSGGQSPD
jgi:hypothetical protein